MNSRNYINLNKNKIKFAIQLQCFCLIALILFRFLYEPFTNRAELLIYPFSCLLCGLTIWYFGSWYFLTKQLFHPYLLFLLSAFLFNGGQALLEIFKLNEDSVIGTLVLPPDLPTLTSEDILHTIFLIIISLGALQLGGLISLATYQNQRNEPAIAETKYLAEDNQCYTIGLRIFYIALLPAILVFRNAIGVVLSSGYQSLYQQDDATGFSAAPNIVADFIIPASLFILAGSRHRPKGKLISITVIIIYAIIKFFTGERNQAAMPLIALAWLWNRWIYPIPKAFLISVGSFILFFVFPLVAVTRNTTGENRLSISFLLEQFASIDNPVIAAISEMGTSMITVAYTLQMVPNYREFQMGADYFYALFTIIPNIFGKLHPTVVRGTPTHWLTEQINPYIASVGGSYGFSFIAEAYLNFGWVGGPIAIGIIGFLLLKLIIWVEKSNEPGKMAMLASFLSFFLFYARAESTLMVRALVWYSLIPYLSARLLKKSSTSQIKHDL